MKELYATLAGTVNGSYTEIDIVSGVWVDSGVNLHHYRHGALAYTLEMPPSRAYEARKDTAQAAIKAMLWAGYCLVPSLELKWKKESANPGACSCTLPDGEKMLIVRGEEHGRTVWRLHPPRGGEISTHYKQGDAKTFAYDYFYEYLRPGYKSQ